MPPQALGTSLVILSMLFFQITFAFYKVANPYLANTHIIFFQSLFSWLLILPFVLKKGISYLGSAHLSKIFVRTIFGLLSLYCVTRALKTDGLAEVNVLNNTAPLFVPIILWIWHRTRIPHKLWIGLVIGFTGICIILIKPQLTEVHSGAIFAFLAGIFSALLLVITRQIAHESFLRILFYYFLVFWIALLPFVLSDWSPFPSFVWIYIVCAAISMVLAQVTFTTGLRHAHSQAAAPFTYISVVFAVLIDWFVWKNVPTLISALGMAIVCIGGLITVNFSKRKES